MPRAILTALPLLMAIALPIRAAEAPSQMQGHDHGAMMGHTHGGASLADGRELVPFPPEMRTHQLANMRDHLATLDGILRNLASGDYEGAAALASARLGLDSPSAEGCKPREAGQPAPPKDSMDAMMELYMPTKMRSLGLAMHTAASDFAAEARKAAKTGDGKAALESLGNITQYCVACHGAYRTQ